MSFSSAIRLYELILPLVKEEEKAKQTVAAIESIVENKVEANKDTLATKEDVAKLDIKISTLDIKISETKYELLRWMIVLFLPFYIGMIIFLVKYFSEG